MVWSQEAYEIRCEWGAEGVARYAPLCDVVVIVDVLSFCTSVDIAVGNGATVYPYGWKDASAAEYAAALNAVLATSSRTSPHGFSLSPASLLDIQAGTRLVLPSPNGATLSLAAGTTPTFAGCLRNADAVARAAQSRGRRVAVIPAGERWDDGSLRPSLEDLIGAGAIIRALPGTRSPEARAAEAVYARFADDLHRALLECASGLELIERGFARDVALASDLDASRSAPLLVNDGYEDGAWARSGSLLARRDADVL